jgi:hypothetical protein
MTKTIKTVKSLSITRRRNGFKVLIYRGKNKTIAEISGEWTHAKGVTEDMLMNYGINLTLPDEMPRKYRVMFEDKVVSSDDEHTFQDFNYSGIRTHD